MRRPAYERSTGYSDTAPAYPHQLQAIQAMQAMQTGPYLVPPPDLQRSLQQPPTSMALRLVPLRAPILAPKSRVNRVLLFAGVVIVTMAIVVLTGLLVFAAGE